MPKNVVLWNPSDDYPSKVYRDSEPIRLVGMHNILESFGYSCEIVDDFRYKYDIGSLVKIISEMNPDILGVSCYADSDSIIYLMRVYPLIMDSLKNKKPITIFGGLHATYNPEDVAVRYQQPDFIVSGEGEPIIEDLALIDFDKKLAKESRFHAKSWDPIFEEQGIDSIVLNSRKSKFSLDALDFERPYDLSDYGYARVEFQRGCTGRCTFCFGDQYRVKYKSPERIREELNYLIREQGINSIRPAGPDFTANPKKAAEIIDMMNRSGFSDFEFGIMTRLDTFYRSLMDHKEIWKTFIKDHGLDCYMGVESFHPKKLVRLKKYSEDNPSRKNQRKMIQQILGEFPKLNISASLILFEPETNVLELVYDCSSAIHLLERSNGRFVLTETFRFMDVSLPGSEVYDKYMLGKGIQKEEDYIKVYRHQDVRDVVEYLRKERKRLRKETKVDADNDSETQKNLKELADGQAGFLRTIVDYYSSFYNWCY